MSVQILAGKPTKRMTRIGIFIGVLVTSKLGIGSAACHINVSIIFQKHGEECSFLMFVAVCILNSFPGISLQKTALSDL